MHSDGMILEIVPDLIEIGLDALNPQVRCMDWRALREATARRCFRRSATFVIPEPCIVSATSGVPSPRSPS